MGGHPSEGGVPIVVLRATLSGLESCLTTHGDLLDHVEADSEMISNTAEASNPGHVELPWGLDRIDARSGLDNNYNRSGTGRGVHVYVADSGIRGTHDEFKALDGKSRVVPTIEVLGEGVVECSASDTSCAADENGHGTHVAGTIGGTKYGVAKEVTLHSVKVTTEKGTGKLSWFLEALDWVAINGKRPAVLSASLGGKYGSASYIVDDAVAAVVDAGVTVVVAAGNGFSDACNFSPASASKAITVGATDKDDVKPRFSNYGKCLNIFAPGVDILSAGIDSDTSSATKSGTSMAAPHVSGAASILLEKHAGLPPREVAEHLQRQATLNAVTNAKDSVNLLLYMGDLAQMTNNISTTTTTTLVTEIGMEGVEGCLKATGPKLKLEEGAVLSCSKFRISGNQVYRIESMEFPGQCLENYYSEWGLWDRRDVYPQEFDLRGSKWCNHKQCVEPSSSLLKIIHKGRCHHHAGWHSANRKQCENAARLLSKKYNKRIINGDKGDLRAFGCLWNKDWNVRYNVNSWSKQDCGALKRSCICARRD